jgi:hypothetical protein
MYIGDPVSRLTVGVHHKKLTAAGAFVTAVDITQRLQKLNDVVDDQRARHPDGDVNDRLGGQAWNRC